MVFDITTSSVSVSSVLDANTRKGNKPYIIGYRLQWLNPSPVQWLEKCRPMNLGKKNMQSSNQQLETKVSPYVIDNITKAENILRSEHLEIVKFLAKVEGTITNQTKRPRGKYLEYDE